MELDGKTLTTDDHKCVRTNFPMFRHHNKIANRPYHFPAVWNDGNFTFAYANEEIGRNPFKINQYKKRADEMVCESYTGNHIFQRGTALKISIPNDKEKKKCNIDGDISEGFKDFAYI